ncbi:hypothetical protein AALP_AAs67487U000400 [Arabis alpina]|uniref:Uncharacterized protein n=1 Tax=Arabis alpina TaxID=50452 RepID=A0A087FXZ7_ARAAL|nr:hypothetical protein AALP_AAs67487U000400 [Arabis alpina]
MGGDVVVENESSSYLDSSPPCSCCFSDDLGFKDENITKFSGHEADLISTRRDKSYQEILQSHDLLQDRVRNSKRKLKLARLQILSYTPGSWADVNLSDYDAPKMTSIIVLGPKGAGKSSLVNKITKVIEDDEFTPARAQESYGTQTQGGTFFVEEYMIPRGGSASFCLYDTRGLNQNSSSDNTSMIEQWITRGVCHGEPVIWNSDSSDLRDRLIRESGTGREFRKVNSVIFVVNAVEILKSMESGTSYTRMISTAFNCPLLSFKDDKPAVVMTHGDILSQEERARVRVFLGELLGIPPEKQIFDIPESRDAATALTICDLLCYSLEHADKNLHFLPKRNFTISKVVGGVVRRRIMLKLRIYLALPLLLALSLNWIRFHGGGQNVVHEAQHKPPIIRPPSRLLYNLTRADQPKRNLRWINRPPKHNLRWINRPPKGKYLSLVPNLGDMPNLECESVPEGKLSNDWHIARRVWYDKGKVAEAEHSIDSHIARRLWYDEGKVAEAEPSIDSHIARRLWYAEEKRAKAKPSFDWRTTRRLWYVE